MDDKIYELTQVISSWKLRSKAYVGAFAFAQAKIVKLPMQNSDAGICSAKLAVGGYLVLT